MTAESLLERLTLSDQVRMSSPGGSRETLASRTIFATTRRAAEREYDVLPLGCEILAAEGVMHYPRGRSTTPEAPSPALPLHWSAPVWTGPPSGRINDQNKSCNLPKSGREGNGLGGRDRLLIAGGTVGCAAPIVSVLSIGRIGGQKSIIIRPSLVTLSGWPGCCINHLLLGSEVADRCYSRPSWARRRRCRRHSPGGPSGRCVQLPRPTV
jgi:hypothetical protein